MTGAAHGLALLAGALAGPAALGLVLRALAPLEGSGRRAIAVANRTIDATLAPLRLAASHGHDPSRAERHRLRIAGGCAGLVAGWALGGGRAAVAGAIAGALALPRAATWRRARYARRVAAGAGPAAHAMAGALSGGASIRTAIGAAAGELEGPISIELRRTAVELEAGARLDAALDGLVDRATSPGIVLLAAAVQLQRRSGGDLAAVLRRLARSLEQQRRAAEEADAATAQARMTSTLVLLVPPAGMLMAEVASPGLIARMLGSSLGAMLVAAAVGLQLCGGVLVRRLARVEP
jgi:tight adherence protein B